MKTASNLPATQAALSILVVEDDPDLRDALGLTLRAAGHQVQLADGGPMALEMLGRSPLHLVVSDLRMSPMDGLEVLSQVRKLEPQLPVLLMTAFGDVEKAVAAMRGGACDFLMKPFEPDVLLQHIARYALVPPQSEGLIAVDVRTRNLLGLASRVAGSDATVLLAGESGTGKEVFARYIHSQSARARGPFVAINCAAIPENLLEATLFGHEKGAFTGAQTAQPGKFEQAQDGTILLDEISEMPLPLQAKLLRVLQEREVERVGGKKPIPLNIRVLATTNRNMAGEVEAGRFREDLYYRLNVFPLAIPALRERADDIVPLAEHHLAQAAQRSGRQLKLSAAAAAILAVHTWPGNVRELVNTMERAVILAPGNVVEAEHILLPSALKPAATNTVSPQTAQLPAANESAGLANAGAASPERMKDLEREHILATLASVGGSRKKAVERLGISERTLRYKLAQWRDEGLFEEKQA